MLLSYIVIDNYWENNTSNQIKDPFQTLTVFPLRSSFVLWSHMAHGCYFSLISCTLQQFLSLPFVFHDPDILKKY